MTLDIDAIERNIAGFSHTHFEVYGDPDAVTCDIHAVTEDIDRPYRVAEDVERHVAEPIVARLNFAPVLVARVRELEAALVIERRNVDHLVEACERFRNSAGLS